MCSSGIMSNLGQRCTCRWISVCPVVYGMTAFRPSGARGLPSVLHPVTWILLMIIRQRVVNIGLSATDGRVLRNFLSGRPAVRWKRVKSIHPSVLLQTSTGGYPPQPIFLRCSQSLHPGTVLIESLLSTVPTRTALSVEGRDIPKDVTLSDALRTMI